MEQAQEAAAAKEPLASNSSLLERLNAFLPRIHAANLELEKPDGDNETRRPLDMDLHKDGEADSASEEESDSEGEEKDKGQVVQLSFALGDFAQDNPVVQLLEGDDDEEPTTLDADGDGNGEFGTKRKAVSQLLEASEPHKKPKGPLIQELE